MFNVTLPEKIELLAPVPPMLMVPVFPACTVTGRPIVNAPLVNRLALLEPDVLPNKMALEALPNAPFAADGALAPTINVPSLIVVVPV